MKAPLKPTTLYNSQDCYPVSFTSKKFWLITRVEKVSVLYGGQEICDGFEIQ